MKKMSHLVDTKKMGSIAPRLFFKKFVFALCATWVLCAPALLFAQAQKQFFNQKLPQLEIALVEISSTQFEIILRELRSSKQPLGEAEVQFIKNPSRLVVDIKGVQLAKNQSFSVNHRVVKGVRFGVHPGQLRLVLDLKSDSVISTAARKGGANSFTINFIVGGDGQSANIEVPPAVEKSHDFHQPAQPTEVASDEQTKPARRESPAAEATLTLRAPFGATEAATPKVVQTVAPTLVPTHAVPTTQPTRAVATATVVKTIKPPATETPTKSATPTPRMTATKAKTVAAVQTPTTTATAKKEDNSSAALPVRKVPEAKTTAATVVPLKIPTVRPTDTPQPTATAVPTIPTIIPTIDKKNIEATSKSRPLSSLLEDRTKEKATEIPAVLENKGVADVPIGPPDAQQYLVDLRFDYQIQNHEPLLRLVMMSGANFNLVKKDSQTYDLIIQKAGIKVKSLAQPHFPPHDFVGFTLVYPKYEKETLTVEIKVDRGTRVTAFARGNEIWIRAATK